MYTLFDNKKTEQKNVFILGHRGCSEFFPENTIISYEDCEKDNRIDGIELDVHLCKSGEIVISHDSCIERTSGKKIVIEEENWSLLKKVDVGSFKGKEFKGTHMPLLEDVFKRFGARFCYDIELKVVKNNSKALTGKVWDLIQKYGLEEKVMVSSFNPFGLKRFNKICWFSVPTADIFSEGPEVPKFLQHGFGHKISHSSYLKPEYVQVNDAFFEKNPDLEAIVWTVNTAEDAKKLLEYPQIRGLIGNNPHILADILEEKIKK